MNALLLSQEGAVLHRRTALRIALAFPVLGLASLGGTQLAAQNADVISEMVDVRPWRDQKVYAELRRLAAVLIDLRVIYSGPNGYESEAEFSRNVFRFWRDAMGESEQEGWLRATQEVDLALDGNLVGRLRDEMADLLAANGGLFVGWLSELGVQPESRLQIDLLRGQALFAVLAAVRLGGGRPSAFADFTWIFPFC